MKQYINHIIKTTNCIASYYQKIFGLITRQILNMKYIKEHVFEYKGLKLADASHKNMTRSYNLLFFTCGPIITPMQYLQFQTHLDYK